MRLHALPAIARRIPWPALLLIAGLAAAAWRIPSPPSPRFTVPTAIPASAAAPRITTTLLPTPAPFAHSSSVAALPGGDVLVAWFTGTREGARDVTIEFARVRGGAVQETWTALTRQGLQSMLGRVVRKIGNPMVSVDSRGTLHLFVVSVGYGGWSGSAINHLESDDVGRSWRSARRLVLSPFFNLSTQVRTPLTWMADGSIGLPAYHEFISKWGLWVRLDAEGDIVACAAMRQPVPTLQPAVVALDAQRAVAALRDGRAEGGRIHWSGSDDGGDRWTFEPPRDVPNPDASVAMIRLRDGSLLLAANPLTGARSLLQLLRSHDEGGTWTLARTIERSDDPNVEVSYPALMQDATGEIFLSYTDCHSNIRLCAFNESWLEPHLADTIAETAVQPAPRGPPASIAVRGPSPYGLVVQWLIVAAALRVPFALARWPSRTSAWRRWIWLPLGLVATAIVSLPIGELSIGGHLRGLFGDLSVTSSLLLATWIVAPSWLPRPPRSALAGVPLAVLAALLYGPLFVFPAMGIDTYALGWQPWLVLAAVALAGIVIRARSGGGAWLVIGAGALFGYALQLLESDNLWDALVDPGVLAVAIGSCVATLVMRFRGVGAAAANRA